jgi:hypothetical protein
MRDMLYERLGVTTCFLATMPKSWSPRPASGKRAIQEGGHSQRRFEYGKLVRAECLTLALRALTRKPPISASMDTFYKMLPKWRRYNEDSEFAGDYASAVLG